MKCINLTLLIFLSAILSSLLTIIFPENAKQMLSIVSDGVDYIMMISVGLIIIPILLLSEGFAYSSATFDQEMWKNGYSGHIESCIRGRMTSHLTLFYLDNDTTTKKETLELLGESDRKSMMGYKGYHSCEGYNLGFGCEWESYSNEYLYVCFNEEGILQETFKPREQ